MCDPHAMPEASSVDSRYAAARLAQDATRPETQPPLWADDVHRGWFAPVVEGRMDTKNPLGWVFDCPFCGVRCFRVSHQETYAWAYGHLRECPSLGDDLSTSGRHEPVHSHRPMPF